MSGNDVERVFRGYTISVRTAALGRIGEDYVMRDRKGHRIVLPIATQPDRLMEVWAEFRRAATGVEAMPPVLAGETVSLNPRFAEPAPSAGTSDPAAVLPA
jgi:hypothetical protein